MEEKLLIPIDDAIEAFRHHLEGNGGTGTCFTKNRSRILINN